MTNEAPAGATEPTPTPAAPKKKGAARIVTPILALVAALVIGLFAGVLIGHATATTTQASNRAGFGSGFRGGEGLPGGRIKNLERISNQGDHPHRRTLGQTLAALRHHRDPREHQPATADLRGVDQVLDRYLPAFPVLNFFREFHDVIGSVLERRQPATATQRYRIIERRRPRHLRRHATRVVALWRLDPV